MFLIISPGELLSLCRFTSKLSRFRLGRPAVDQLPKLTFRSHYTHTPEVCNGTQTKIFCLSFLLSGSPLYQYSPNKRFQIFVTTF